MITFDETFSVIDKTLTFIGLSGIYNRDPKKGFNPARLFYVIGLANLLPLLFGEMIFFAVQLAQGDSDQFFFEVTDMMACFIESLFSFVKSSAIVLHAGTLQSLVNELRQLCPRDMDPLVRDSMMPTKHICLVYTLVTNILSSVYNVIPLIIMCFNFFSGNDHELLLPYHIWYPYDWKVSSGVYTFTYISQVYAGIFTTAAVSSVDCMFCLIVANLSMHFKILQKQMLNMNDSKISKRQLKQNLENVVDYHNALKNMCKKVEIIFGPSLLVNLAASSVIICVAIFSITISPPIRILNYLLFLSSSLIQILMMSWYGNTLIEESKAVSMAAYQSKWIDTEKDHRKAIMMIQMRTSKPIAISAMGYFDISLSTFSSILSASWSYFALLKTMYQKQES